MNPAEQVLVFDMDGVLVEVTESYRETIVQTVENFTGKTITAITFRTTKIAAAGTTTGCSRRRSAATWVRRGGLRTVVENFNGLFLQPGPDSLAKDGFPAGPARTSGRTLRTRHLHRPLHAMKPPSH